jgi:hypothetical protein
VHLPYAMRPQLLDAAAVTLRMPRFYFHVVAGPTRIPDQEGAELPHLEMARQEAISAARELVADALRSGRSLSSALFEIADASGRVITTVPFPKVEIPH